MGGRGKAGSESEHGRKGEETEAEAEAAGEVVQRLRVLEQKANVSEVILRTMARKTLGVGATRALEGFAVALSSPVPAPSSMVQARFRLETQVGVLQSLELDAGKTRGSWKGRKWKKKKRRSQRSDRRARQRCQKTGYEPSEESGEELGLEVEEEPEPEPEVGLDTPPPPEPVLESGSEDWDSTLR